MGNQHTVKKAAEEKKVSQAAIQATNGKEKSQQDQGKLGDLPDFSQECTGCTTLRSEISKLKDKVSSIVAAKNDTDEIFEIRKMVTELTERLDATASNGQQADTALLAVLPVLENHSSRLGEIDANIKYVFEIMKKVWGTTKISQL